MSGRASASCGDRVLGNHNGPEQYQHGPTVLVEHTSAQGFSTGWDSRPAQAHPDGALRRTRGVPAHQISGGSFHFGKPQRKQRTEKGLDTNPRM